MKTFAVFIGTLALCAGLAWLSGYNFDHRDRDVFFGSLICFGISAAVATIYETSKL